MVEQPIASSVSIGENRLTCFITCCALPVTTIRKVVVKFYSHFPTKELIVKRILKKKKNNNNLVAHSSQSAPSCHMCSAEMKPVAKFATSVFIICHQLGLVSIYTRLPLGLIWSGKKTKNERESLPLWLAGRIGGQPGVNGQPVCLHPEMDRETNRTHFSEDSAD